MIDGVESAIAFTDLLNRPKLNPLTSNTSPNFSDAADKNPAKFIRVSSSSVGSLPCSVIKVSVSSPAFFLEKAARIAI